MKRLLLLTVLACFVTAAIRAEETDDVPKSTPFTTVIEGSRTLKKSAFVALDSNTNTMFLRALVAANLAKASFRPRDLSEVGQDPVTVLIQKSYRIGLIVRVEAGETVYVHTIAGIPTLKRFYMARIRYGQSDEAILYIQPDTFGQEVKLPMTFIPELPGVDNLRRMLTPPREPTPTPTPKTPEQIKREKDQDDFLKQFEVTDTPHQLLAPHGGAGATTPIPTATPAPTPTLTPYPGAADLWKEREKAVRQEYDAAWAAVPEAKRLQLHDDEARFQDTIKAFDPPTRMRTLRQRIELLKSFAPKPVRKL